MAQADYLTVKPVISKPIHVLRAANQAVKDTDP